MRTVHQQEAKAQLVVAVERQAGNPWNEAHAAGALPDAALPRGEIEAACNGQVGQVGRRRHKRSSWAGGGASWAFHHLV